MISSNGLSSIATIGFLSRNVSTISTMGYFTLNIIGDGFMPRIYSQFIDKDHKSIVDFHEDFVDQLAVEIEEIITGLLNINSYYCFKWLVDILGRQVNLRRLGDSDDDFKLKIAKKRTLIWLQSNIQDWYRFAYEVLTVKPNLIRVIQRRGDIAIFHDSDDWSDYSEYSNKIRSGGSALYLPFADLNCAILDDALLETMSGTYDGIFYFINSSIFDDVDNTDKLLLETAYVTFGTLNYTSSCTVAKVAYESGNSYCYILVNLEAYDENGLVTYFDTDDTDSGTAVSLTLEGYFSGDSSDKTLKRIEFLGTLEHSHQNNIMFKLRLFDNGLSIQIPQKNLYEFDHTTTINDVADSDNVYQNSILDTII